MYDGAVDGKRTGLYRLNRRGRAEDCRFIPSRAFETTSVASDGQKCLSPFPWTHFRVPSWTVTYEVIPVANCRAVGCLIRHLRHLTVNMDLIKF
jgi:hypothetical protein